MIVQMGSIALDVFTSALEKCRSWDKSANIIVELDSIVANTAAMPMGHLTGKIKMVNSSKIFGFIG
jgi:hypothetical protein